MKFRTAVLSQVGQLLKIESLNCADWRVPLKRLRQRAVGVLEIGQNGKT